MINSGQPDDAIELLMPLEARHPHHPQLQYYLGYARVKVGDLWGGVAHYEKARTYGGDSSLWIPIASLYLDLGLRALASNAYQQALRHNPKHPALKELPDELLNIELEIEMIADSMDISSRNNRAGLRLMEEAQIALHTADYTRCIGLNRKAIKYLKRFPPPHNNLSLAYFFNGQPEKAIQTAREVTAYDPNNIQALANLVRFMAWTLHESEARETWEYLKRLTPQEDSHRVKMIEAAAILNDDEDVYRLINELEVFVQADSGFTQRIQLHLAIAEANLGRKSARKRLSKLKAQINWAGNILEAFKKGQSGLGWTDRFPYFHASDLIPNREFESFITLVGISADLHPQTYRRKIDRFLSRFPQMALIGKKTLLEDQQVDAGISILSTIGTPEAYNILREFATSKNGSDDDRLQALQVLQEAEQIDPAETIRFWQNGEWQDIQFRMYKIDDEPDVKYSDQVIELLTEGFEASKAGNLEQAEDAFLRVIEIAPGVIEAYNNLASIYSQRDELERAKEMLKKALEINPNYVMARCNLALFLLNDNAFEEAEETIKPLADVTRYSSQEMAFLSYIRAHIDVKYKRYDQAQHQLGMALEIQPDYEPAQNLLGNLGTLKMLDKAQAGWQRRQQDSLRRQQAGRAKRRLQITSPDPDLTKALGIYTKEAMTGMGRVILPWGGWSALRKAELYEHLVESLQDKDVLQGIVSDLSDEELNALRQVLDRGGHISWEDFAAKFGDDLEESQYWQYHQPETVMGRLRIRSLLAETTVNDQLQLTIPTELRAPLRELV